MKNKFLPCLALVLSNCCHAALVYSLSPAQARQITGTNIDLKYSRSYEAGLTNLVSNRLLSTAVLMSAGFSGDAFDAKIPRALQIAEQLPQVKERDYEPRLLDISPILFVAVWLHGEKDDIIIPLPPTWNRWNAYQSYSEKELIPLLKPEAEKKLKYPRLFD
jgi:hypothetical protein